MKKPKQPYKLTIVFYYKKKKDYRKASITLTEEQGKILSYWGKSEKPIEVFFDSDGRDVECYNSKLKHPLNLVI